MYYTIQSMNGTLYVVSTPIGNLEDITLRALRHIFSVDVIACEDTRRTGLLLEAYSQRITNQEFGIKGLDIAKKPRLVSYYDDVEQRKTPEIIQLLLDGNSVALVSDAGTPLVSDPGYLLVREAIKRDIPVVPVPGPSSVVAALTASGLPTDQFLFLGYLPDKQSKRKKFLQSATVCIASSKDIHPTVVFLEAPHRLSDSLKDVQDVCGDIEVVIARELTKMNEEVLRGKISDVLHHPSLQSPKGEFVILVRFESK